MGNVNGPLSAPKAAPPPPPRCRYQQGPDGSTHPGEPGSFHQRWKGQLASLEQTLIWSTDLCSPLSVLCRSMELPTAFRSTSHSAAPGKGLASHTRTKEVRFWHMECASLILHLSPEAAGISE